MTIKMMRKRDTRCTNQRWLILLAVMQFFSLPLSAQKLAVESMELLPNDASAASYETQMEYDTGLFAGIVKVYIALDGVEFEGQGVLKQEKRGMGEYWVWLAKDSSRLKVRAIGFLPLDVNFRSYEGVSVIHAKSTYKLVLTVPVAGQVQQDDGISYLIMTVTPKNSMVYVDDAAQPVNEGVMRVPLPYGQHRYRVDAPGYASKQGTVEMGAERKDLAVTLESLFATLRVSCDTPGAQIYVNDQLRGTAPWSGQLPPGNYVVEARKPGSHSQRQMVTLEERANRSITLPSLIAQVGRLDVDYQPVNAEVWLDGKLLGKSPNIFRDIATGSHSVELRATGYTSKTESLTVEEGKTARLAGSLTKLPDEDAEIEGKTPEQIRDLGYYYREGTGGKTPNYAKALKYARIAAERGNTEAINDIGLMYDKGLGVTQDYAEAVKWYQKAAEQGHAWGQYNLGLMYEYGRGVTQDYVEAVKWYRKAAEQGNAGGQNNLGVKYTKGLGVTQDYAEAVKWYRKAAEQGHALGQNNLGYMYDKGLGVTQDYSEAVKWYQKSAEQGNADGQCNLGYMYEMGYGVTQNKVEAVKWYRKAAEQGHAVGQYNLAQRYRYGGGVDIDLTQAKYWYEKAAAQGYEDAKKQLNTLK